MTASLHLSPEPLAVDNLYSQEDHDSMLGKGTCLAVLGMVACGNWSWCQVEPEAASPKFTVASIKPSQPVGRLDVQTSGGTLTATHISARQLIKMAYRLQEFQLKGGPGWIETDRFDVAAKAETPLSQAQVYRALQVLLADRFALTIHRDAAEHTGLAFVVSKAGLKLEPAMPSDGSDPRFSSTPGKEPGTMVISCPSASIAQLATVLSSLVGAPLADETALTGRFRIRLELSMEKLRPQAAAPDADPSVHDPKEGGQSIFQAVESQLGLKLETRKVPAETIVIDHIARPTEN